MGSCLNVVTLPFDDDTLRWMAPASFALVFIIGFIAYLADKKKWINFPDAVLLSILIALIFLIMGLSLFWSMAGIDLRTHTQYTVDRPGCKVLYYF